MSAPGDYDPSEYPPFAVTADTVVFRMGHEGLAVVLVQRAHQPFQGRWALPGGFVEIEEDLRPAAARELEEETGLVCTDLRQLAAYGTPGRDPRMRVVTVVFWARADNHAQLRAGDDAASARWWSVDELLAEPDLLAFDHHQILTDAVAAFEDGV